MSALGRVLWYPTPSTYRVSDLGRVWTGMQEDEHREESVIDNAYGCRSVVFYAGYRHIDIAAELLSSAATARELEAVLNHIRRYQPVAIAENDDCFIGGQVSPVGPGETELVLATQPWVNWGDLVFTEGTTFVLKSPGPNYFREEVTATAFDGTTLTISTPTIYDYTNEPFVWAHDKALQPFVRLRSGQRPRLVHDRRITWNLSLPMEEVPITVDALALPFAGP